MNEILIRDARDDDGDALIALIETCWADYPGCFLDVDGENPELRWVLSWSSWVDQPMVQ